MDFARAVGDTTTVEMGKIAYKYPEKSSPYLFEEEWCSIDS